jgi:hypothetical protein
MGIRRLTEWTGPASSLLAGKQRRRVGTASHPELATEAPTGAQGDGWWQLAPEDGNEDQARDRLSVFQMADGWTGRQGDEMTTIRGMNSEGAYQRGEVVLTSNTLAAESAAVSYMSASPFDVRPLLLLMFHGEDLTKLEGILRYGIGYLGTWASRSGLLTKTPAERRAEAIRWATADGLALLYGARLQRRPGDSRGRWAFPSADNRAAKIGVREETFGLLRSKAVALYEMRLTEARSGFRATVEGAETKRRNYGEKAPGQYMDGWWKPTNARAQERDECTSSGA